MRKAFQRRGMARAKARREERPQGTRKHPAVVCMAGCAWEGDGTRARKVDGDQFLPRILI